VLDTEDDIIYFRYTKRINQETGPVIIGIDTPRNDRERLIQSMRAYDIQFKCLSGITAS
jgi:hypothetical protein